jgi:hypothetical protein
MEIATAYSKPRNDDIFFALLEKIVTFVVQSNGLQT